jgi:hypothetical protein
MAVMTMMTKAVIRDLFVFIGRVNNPARRLVKAGFENFTACSNTFDYKD